MKRLILIALAVGLFIVSCGKKPADPTPEIPVKKSTNSTDSMCVLNQGVYDLNLEIPKVLITDEFQFKYRPSFGDAVLYVNEKFHVVISKEEVDLFEMKAEFENGGLFSYKFYDEADDELMYQAVLPDGEELGFHWVKKMKIKNEDFVLKTDPQGDFSRENIRKIQEILTTLK